LSTIPNAALPIGNAWNAHLGTLGISSLKVNPATRGPWGSSPDHHQAGLGEPPMAVNASWDAASDMRTLLIG
jgi:hypothetical protein